MKKNKRGVMQRLTTNPSLIYLPIACRPVKPIHVVFNPFAVVAADACALTVVMLYGRITIGYGVYCHRNVIPFLEWGAILVSEDRY